MNKDRKVQRKTRTRKKIKQNVGALRLSVFRSNKYIYAHIIDDRKGTTLLGVSEAKVLGKDTKGSKVELARRVGLELAKKALEKNIKTVVFDKGGYAYHGRVKALAKGALEGGLQF